MLTKVDLRRIKERVKQAPGTYHINTYNERVRSPSYGERFLEYLPDTDFQLRLVRHEPPEGTRSREQRSLRILAPVWRVAEKANQDAAVLLEEVHRLRGLIAKHRQVVWKQKFPGLAADADLYREALNNEEP
jgi:hypothetical protein